MAEQHPKPMKGKILVEVVDSMRMSKSGMAKPMAANGPTAMGFVVDVGAGVTEVTIGQFVHFDRTVARIVSGPEKVYHIVTEGAVLATEEADQVQLVENIEQVPLLVGANGQAVS